MTPVYFFNGWGMDESAVSHLADGRNITIIGAHPDAPVPAPEVPAVVIAWSFGVWKASRWLNQNAQHVSRAIAVNGTAQGIHSEFGIPPATAAATLAGFSGTSRPKLYRRIFGRQPDVPPAREVTEQKDELQALIRAIESEQLPVSRLWQHAWVSEFDPIFNQDNQLNAWQQTPAVIHRLDAPHHLLSRFADWQQFLDACDDV